MPKSANISKTSHKSQPTRHNEVAQVGRFLVVGVINTIVDFGLLNILAITILPKSATIGNFSLLGLAISLNGLIIAGIISGTVAMIVSFVLNANFTFRVRHVSGKRTVYFFAITIFGLYMVRPIILKIMTDVWHWPAQFTYTVTRFLHLPLSQSFDERNIALVAAILVVLVYNYLMYKWFVFRDER